LSWFEDLEWHCDRVGGIELGTGMKVDGRKEAWETSRKSRGEGRGREGKVLTMFDDDAVHASNRSLK
jgi:hypothetical protein